MSTSFNTETTGENVLDYPGGSSDVLGFDDGSPKLSSQRRQTHLSASGDVLHLAVSHKKRFSSLVELLTMSGRPSEKKHARIRAINSTLGIAPDSPENNLVISESSPTAMDSAIASKSGIRFASHGGEFSRLLYVERGLFSGQLAGDHEFASEEETRPKSVEEQRPCSPDEERDGVFYFRDTSQSGSRFFFDLTDDEISGRLDLSVPLSAEGLIKIGGLHRNRDRTFDARRFRFEPADNADQFVDRRPPKNFLRQSFASLLGQQTTTSHRTPYGQATQWSIYR